MQWPSHKLQTGGHFASAIQYCRHLYNFRFWDKNFKLKSPGKIMVLSQRDSR
jgi:hypothetical protein